MPSKICPQCNAEYELHQSFCPIDGAALRLPASKDGDLAGRIFSGRYKLLRKLGGGGMGNVYLAEHVRLKSLAAVKVIRPVLNDDADAAARFNREAQNASLINHPNVASVFDFGEADGMMFLAMEYVDGEPLSELIKRGPLAPDTARRIVSQVGEALTAAHRLGIVHRDLKPDNIMISTGTDGGEFVKLVDFGISKITSSTDQKVTATGAIIGTPAYMSPEQASSDKGVDARSDIYSFGVLTFQMLTASLPFTGETAQEQIVSRLMHPPAKLSAARPDIPWAPAIEDSLAKAMATDPNLRFSTAQEFARDFDTAVRSGAVRQSKTVRMDTAEVQKELASAKKSAAAAAGTPAPVPDAEVPNTRVVAAGPRYALWGGAGLVAAAAVGFVLMTQSKKETPAADSTRAPIAASNPDAIPVNQSGTNVGQPPKAANKVETSTTPARGATGQVIASRPDSQPSGGRTGQVAPFNQQLTPANPPRVPAAAAETPKAPAATETKPQTTQAVDLAPDIQKLKEMVAASDKDPAEYKAAYDKSVALVGRATATSDSLMILYYQAKALVFLDETPRACRSLAQAGELAKATPLERTIARTKEQIGCR